MKALSFILPLLLTICACSSSTHEHCTPSNGFWKDYDFCDTTMITDASLDVERHFVEYINHIYYMEKDSLKNEFDEFISYISSCDKSERYFSELIEKYLYQPRNTSHIEDMYLTYLECYISSPCISEEKKIRPQMHIEEIAKNAIGSTATDFVYTLSNGEKHQLHHIKTPLTLLYFNNPLCEECSSTLEEMKNSSILNEMINKGEISVLSVYVDDAPEEWRENLSHYPSNWVVAIDEGRHIDNERLYSIRIIPSIYLLGKDKEVILKNTTWKEVEKKLEK